MPSVQRIFNVCIILCLTVSLIIFLFLASFWRVSYESFYSQLYLALIYIPLFKEMTRKELSNVLNLKIIFSVFPSIIILKLYFGMCHGLSLHTACQQIQTNFRQNITFLELFPEFYLAFVRFARGQWLLNGRGVRFPSRWVLTSSRSHPPPPRGISHVVVLLAGKILRRDSCPEIPHPVTRA